MSKWKARGRTLGVASLARMAGGYLLGVSLVGAVVSATIAGVFGAILFLDE